MVKHQVDSNQKVLLRRKESEESNKIILFRRVADPNQHGQNLQECVGKVKTMKTDLIF